MGYRIELGDIESNIMKIAGVKDCAVIAKYSSENAVKKITAFVSAEDGIDSVRIKTALSEMIPQYMIPKTVKFLEKLPVNENGKTDRKALNLL